MNIILNNNKRYVLNNIIKYNKYNNIKNITNNLKFNLNSILWIDYKNKEYKINEKYINVNNRIKNKWVDIISWNILGPNQGENSKYEYCTLDSRLWKRREQRIIDYLLLVRPSIICLQEVSYDSISSDAFSKLAEVGYVCAAFSSSFPPELINQKKPHSNIGCAIFVQQEKVAIVSSHKLTLSNFAPMKHCQSDVYLDLINSDTQSMIVCQLLLKHTHQKFFVANTHLISNDLQKDIKAIQTQSIVNALTKVIKHEVPELEQNNNEILPIILCGDFNTEPMMKENQDTITHPSLQNLNNTFELLTHKLTAPFHILSKGSLPSNHPEHPDTWNLQHRKKISPGLGMFLSRHPKLKMTNIYLDEKFKSQQPLWTTKTDDFQGWIDHIWTNSDAKIRRVLCPPVKALDPGVEQINSSFSPIPTKIYPSDHIPIGCVVSFPTPTLNSSIEKQSEINDNDKLNELNSNI